jgi:hypothetical protein
MRTNLFAVVFSGSTPSLSHPLTDIGYTCYTDTKKTRREVTNTSCGSWGGRDASGAGANEDDKKIVIISNIIRYDYHGGGWGVGGDGVMCAWVWRGVEGCRYCNMTPQRPWSYRKYLHMRHVFKILMFYRASICSIPDSPTLHCTVHVQ